MKKNKEVLSIDAIEIALFRKEIELIKNLFLFFFIPVNIPEKSFPIIEHENGMSGLSEFIDQLKIIMLQKEKWLTLTDIVFIKGSSDCFIFRTP